MPIELKLKRRGYPKLAQGKSQIAIATDRMVEIIKLSKPTAPKFGIEAFSTSTKPWQNRGATVTFKQRVLGELNVPSGKLVAGDAFFSSLQLAPLHGSVAAGKYPVTIAEAHFQPLHVSNRQTADVRAALGKITFSDSPIVSWEYADTSPVDSGTWGFCDFTTATRLRNSFNSKADTDLLLSTLEKNTKTSEVSWADLAVAPGYNQISFSCGFGDGSYASFWGLDANGKICALVSDFDLFLEPVAPTPTVEPSK